MLPCASWAICFLLLPFAWAAQQEHYVDDDDPRIIYSGTWYPQDAHKSGLDYGGSHSLSEDPSAYATFTFTGVAFYYLSSLWPYPVDTTITLDGGVPIELNLMDPDATPADGGSASSPSRSRWSATGLRNRLHTVVISMASQYIVVDGFRYVSDDGEEVTTVATTSTTRTLLPTTTATTTTTTIVPPPITTTSSPLPTTATRTILQTTTLTPFDPPTRPPLETPSETPAETISGTPSDTSESAPLSETRVSEIPSGTPSETAAPATAPDDFTKSSVVPIAVGASVGGIVLTAIVILFWRCHRRETDSDFMLDDDSDTSSPFVPVRQPSMVMGDSVTYSAVPSQYGSQPSHAAHPGAFSFGAPTSFNPYSMMRATASPYEVQDFNPYRDSSPLADSNNARHSRTMSSGSASASTNFAGVSNEMVADAFVSSSANTLAASMKRAQALALAKQPILPPEYTPA